MLLSELIYKGKKGEKEDNWQPLMATFTPFPLFMLILRKSWLKNVRIQSYCCVSL